jgi:DNA replication and repair protein RecF
VFVRELYVKNFRNYREATVEAPPGLIFVVGPNGAGKTNLLEALHFVAVGRSFRTSRDRDLLRCDTSEPLTVRATVHSSRGEQTFELTYDGTAKRAALNGEVLPRLLDYVGNLPLVAFGPDDLALVKGDPAARRRFLDVWLNQESRDYRYTLHRYYTVLRSRNALLARGAPASEREPFDHDLVTSGAHLTRLRAAAGEALAPQAAAAYRELAPEEEDLAVAYVSALSSAAGTEEEIASRFGRELAALREEETRRGQTLLGPHRDDLDLRLQGREARRFASEGQQRTAALSLRLAQFRLLARGRGEAPLLLLDDVASELDASRQSRLGRALEGAEQTWLTSTEPLAEVEPEANITISESRIEVVTAGGPTSAQNEAF